MIPLFALMRMQIAIDANALLSLFKKTVENKIQLYTTLVTKQTEINIHHQVTLLKVRIICPITYQQ